MRPRLGILGVGHLASFLVEGLSFVEGPARVEGGPEVVLSPRNAARSADLAARFGAVVADDNQAVVDAADLVVLSTRPADAVEAARTVSFRAEHTVISVVASLPCAALQPAVAPATLVRAMPISCARIAQSPTVLYPDHAAARELLERIGTVHVLTDESQFAVATSIAAFYSWTFALLDRAVSWAADHGLPHSTARQLVLGNVRGAANLALARPDQELDVLLASLTTPGGLTEHGLEVLDLGGGLDAWAEALEAIRRRLDEG